MWRVTCLRTANRGHPKNGSCRLVPSSQLIFGARPEPQDVYVMKFLLRFLQLCLKHNHHCVRLKLDPVGLEPFSTISVAIFSACGQSTPRAPRPTRPSGCLASAHQSHGEQTWQLSPLCFHVQLKFASFKFSTLTFPFPFSFFSFCVFKATPFCICCH